MSTSSSPTTPHDGSFVCGCEDPSRIACRGENFYKEHDGKRYCILHYPGTEKKEDFQKALRRKLDAKDFNFREVWFPNEISFGGFTFSAAAFFSSAYFSADAYFGYAKFTSITDFDGAQFIGDADFKSAEFLAGAYFPRAQFSKSANFGYAKFNKVTDFNSAQFNATADFRSAQFSESAYFVNVAFKANVNFHRTGFTGKDRSQPHRAISAKVLSASNAIKAKAETIEVDFARASFKDGVSFELTRFVDRIFVSFAAATFEKPERTTFHSIPLRPHWFINVDSRKFTFIDVNWGFLNKPDAIRKEIVALERSGKKHLSSLLDITFRQLAVNAEENNRYEEAANFRYMAMEVKRLQRRRKVDLFRLSWWYWLLSGYGERVQRAFGALLIIWLLFAFIYWSGNATWWQPKQASRFVVESSEREKQPIIAIAPLTFPEALIYSAGVMTLQKPEPLPANKRAKAFILFEAILGPLQAALLALAIRRKFMR